MNPPPIKDAKASAALSDFFPPSLVKDMRQSFKNPLYMTLVILGILFMSFSAGNTTPFEVLFACVIGLFGFIIPMRAGMTVASDLKERGSNFMMLSPLSPTKIIWGQFLSNLLQVLLLSLLIMPILHHSLCVDVAASLDKAIINNWGDRIQSIKQNKILIENFSYTAALFLGLISGASVMIALMMMAAIIPILGRLILGFFGPLVIYGLFYPNFIYGATVEATITNLFQYSPVLFIATCFLLLLARRHYASPSELSSGAIRGLALLYVLGASAWYYVDPLNKIHLNHMGYCLIIVLLSLALDELLPRESMKRSLRRHCFFLRTNTLMTLLSMLFFAALLTAGYYFALQSQEGALSAVLALYLPDMLVSSFIGQAALCFACMALAAMFSFYAPLIITNFIVARNKRTRLIAFACSVLALTVLWLIIGASLELQSPKYLPFFAYSVFCEFWGDFVRMITMSPVTPKGATTSVAGIKEFMSFSPQPAYILGGATLLLGLLACVFQRRR